MDVIEEVTASLMKGKVIFLLNLPIFLFEPRSTSERKLDQ